MGNIYGIKIVPTANINITGDNDIRNADQISARGTLCRQISRKSPPPAAGNATNSATPLMVVPPTPATMMSPVALAEMLIPLSPESPLIARFKPETDAVTFPGTRDQR
jgi:hypothetical protein